MSSLTLKPREGAWCHLAPPWPSPLGSHFLGSAPQSQLLCPSHECRHASARPVLPALCTKPRVPFILKSQRKEGTLSTLPGGQCTPDLTGAQHPRLRGGDPLSALTASYPCCRGHRRTRGTAWPHNAGRARKRSWGRTARGAGPSPAGHLGTEPAICGPFSGPQGPSLLMLNMGNFKVSPAGSQVVRTALTTNSPAISPGARHLPWAAVPALEDRWRWQNTREPLGEHLKGLSLFLLLSPYCPASL